MTTIPAQATRGAAGPAARPAGPGGGQLAAPTLDPLKLLKKYLWLFVASGLVGVLVGFGAFQVWRRVHPTFRADVIFEAKPPPQAVGEFDQGVSEQEFTRFIANQAAFAQSSAVLEAVVRDPRLSTKAPGWAAKFDESGLGNVNEPDAIKGLESIVSVRPETGTSYFTLTVRWRTPADTTELAALVKESYLKLIERNANDEVFRRTEALRQQVESMEQQIDALRTRRNQRLDSGNVVNLEQNRDTEMIQLADVATQINELQNERTIIAEQQARYATMARGVGADGAGPVRFDDEILATVENSQSLLTLKAQLNALKVSRTSMRERGVSPEHRDVRRIEGLIAATEANIDAEREAELLRTVGALRESAAQRVVQLDAALADMAERRTSLETRMSSLTRTLKEIEDLDGEINLLERRIVEDQSNLADLESRVAASPAERVTVAQSERLPDRMASPNLVQVVALSLFFVVGLTGTAVITRELLDQRVKGPSDVAMIPRATVLGFVPLAAEDPANPKHIETIFRDQPRGVLAESLRQIRTRVLKQMGAVGHRSLMVIAGSPGSGGTTLSTNLATAVAAADRRVLLVDANFRRPTVHKVFGLDEQRGLSDVLAGELGFDEAVCKTDTERLDVLSAGGREHRVFERLGGQTMARFLAGVADRYDLVLFDVAPAVVAGDGASLATQVDASILVVRAMNEKRGMVARLRSELGDTRAELLGVVVNGVRAAAGGYMRRNIRVSHEYQNDLSGRGDSIDAPPRTRPLSA